MSTQPKSMNSQEWGLLVFLSVLWGGAFFFNEIGLQALPPLTLVFVRVFLAASVLLPLLWYAKHDLPRTLSGWTPFIVMGVLNNVIPFSFLVFGQSFITAGLTSIINAMTPLFTILVMASFREEALTLPRIIGVLLGVLGVAVLRGFDGQVGWDQTIGILLCLCGTLSYGFAALWGRRNLGGIPPMKSATCQLISSSLILLVIVSIVDRPWTLAMPSLEIWLALLALAVFSTALAYIVFFEIMARAGASNVMLVTLLIPVTAILLGYAFLDEAIRLREILGALIIGCGLLFIDGRILNLFRKPKPQGEKNMDGDGI